ncbi:hypothetical protein ROZALSC1DRAFT_26290, partial [Rozella allomycis CSF55]
MLEEDFRESDETVVEKVDLDDEENERGGMEINQNRNEDDRKDGIKWINKGLLDVDDKNDNVRPLLFQRRKSILEEDLKATSLIKKNSNKILPPTPAPRRFSIASLGVRPKQDELIIESVKEPNLSKDQDEMENNASNALLDAISVAKQGNNAKAIEMLNKLILMNPINVEAL